MSLWNCSSLRDSAVWLLFQVAPDDAQPLDGPDGVDCLFEGPVNVKQIEQQDRLIDCQQLIVVRHEPGGTCAEFAAACGPPVRAALGSRRCGKRLHSSGLLARHLSGQPFDMHRRLHVGAGLGSGHNISRPDDGCALQAASALTKTPIGFPWAPLGSTSGEDFVPVPRRISRTSAGDSVGLTESIKAATPATFGAAPDVPPKLARISIICGIGTGEIVFAVARGGSHDPRAPVAELSAPVFRRMPTGSANQNGTCRLDRFPVIIRKIGCLVTVTGRYADDNPRRDGPADGGID